MATLNRMNFFWGKANCPPRFKLQVFDAVIRSKLVYGLDTVQIPPPLMSRLNTFQLKGLRKILQMKTTFITRANTNQKVFDKANAIFNPKQLPNKNIKPFSSYVFSKQESLLKHIVRSPNEDPLRQATLSFNSPIPFTPSSRRVGRPRANWSWETYKRLYVNHNYGDADTWKLNPANAVRSMEADIKNRLI